MKKFLLISLLSSVCAVATAKLPPPSEEDKAKAAEAAAKAAWAGKVDVYKLCLVQDKVAAGYFASAKAAGKDTKTALATPPCSDPGAFVAAPVEAPKPIEASGAHSPATTAANPPSTIQPDAVINPAKKP